MMRAFILWTAIAAYGPFSASADETANRSKEDDRDAVIHEMLAGLPKDGERANSARLELEYCQHQRFAFLYPPVRKAVKTKDGQTAEVIVLRAPAMSMPGAAIPRKLPDYNNIESKNFFASCVEVHRENLNGGFNGSPFRAGFYVRQSGISNMGSSSHQ